MQRSSTTTRAILNSWQVAAVGLFASGGPAGVTFTTTDNADITGGGDPGRINMNCDPNDFKHTFDKWFDTSCFSRPARGDFGNAPRQMIRLQINPTFGRVTAAGEPRVVQLSLSWMF